MPLLPHLHVLQADTNLGRAPDALEDVFLDVRHTVLVTDGSDLRCHSLIRQHTQIGEHVVLDLIVEPPMHEVIGVAAGPKICRADHGTEVKLVALDLDGGLKPVDVLTRVVGDDDGEGVEVGQDLGRHQVGQRRHRHGRAKERVQDPRRQHKVRRQVRTKHLEKAFGRPHVALKGLVPDVAEGGWFCDVAIPAWLLPGVEQRRLGCESSRLRSLCPLAFPALLLLKCVGRVVVPLPHTRDDGHVNELEKEREFAIADVVRIALDQIRIAPFPQPVLLLIPSHTDVSDRFIQGI